MNRSASSSRLTRQQARSQNIAVPDPVSQLHTLEFLAHKKQKEEAAKPSSSTTVSSNEEGSTPSKILSYEKEKRKEAELAKVGKAIEKETAARRSKQAAIEQQAAAANDELS